MEDSQTLVQESESPAEYSGGEVPDSERMAQDNHGLMEDSPALVQASELLV